MASSRFSNLVAVQRRLYGDTNPIGAVFGDSLVAESGNQRSPYGACRSLRPPRGWRGWMSGGIDTSGGCPTTRLQGPAGSGTGNAVESNHGFGAVLGGEGGSTYSTVAADAASFPTIISDALWSGNDGAFTGFWKYKFAQTDRAAFTGGDWMAGAATGRFLIYRSGTSGLSSVYVAAARNAVQTAFTSPQALSVGYNSIDLDLGTGASDATMDFGADASGTDETGKNLCLLATRWTATASSGLTLGFFGKGSSHVADHTDITRVSDAAITAFVSALGVNTCIFWIGENDSSIDATWQTNYAAWIQRWRAAIGSSFRGFIINSYQTSQTNAAKVDAMWAKILGITASDVGAYNLGNDDNGYALNNSLLADTIHMNAAGATYLWGRVHSALMEAQYPLARTTYSIGNFARHSAWKRKALTRHTRR